MIEIFPQAKELSNKIISKLQRYTIDEIDLKYHHSDLNFTWENYLWTDKTFRRAHVEIVDAEQKDSLGNVSFTIHNDDIESLIKNAIVGMKHMSGVRIKPVVIRRKSA